MNQTITPIITALALLLSPIEPAVERITLTNPPPGYVTESNTLNFSWTAKPNVRRFNIVITQGGAIYHEAYLDNGRSYTYTFPDEFSGCWYIRAMMLLDDPPVFSETRCFSIQTPPSPPEEPGEENEEPEGGTTAPPTESPGGSTAQKQPVRSPAENKQANLPKPALKLVIDQDLRTIQYQIGNQPPETDIEIYNLAGLHLDTSKNSGDLIQQYVPSTTYKFRARFMSSSGLKGEFSSWVAITTPTPIENADKQPVTKPKPTIGTCEILINLTHNKLEQSKCNLKTPKLNSTKNIRVDKDLYWIELKGAIDSKIELKTTTYECKKKSITDPRTLYSCVRDRQTKYTHTINPQRTYLSSIGGQSLRQYQSKTDKSGFSILHAHGKNMAGKSARTHFESRVPLRFSGKKFTLNIKSSQSNERKVSKVDDRFTRENSKYFRLTFNRNIGVTQWHGYTAYASPHTGIDFGAVKENIFAPADGYIQNVGWDNYLGKCNSGGYFINIKHDNGMHSVYLHLTNYIGRSGKQLRKGDRVRKGELIGTTGNSGAYNCNPLGFHLHQEIRTAASQSTHTDPVKWTEAEWHLIPTLQADRYPGRLTGNNPHPGR